MRVATGGARGWQGPACIPAHSRRSQVCADYRAERRAKDGIAKQRLSKGVRMQQVWHVVGKDLMILHSNPQQAVISMCWL